MISGWMYPLTFLFSLVALFFGAFYETNFFAYLAIALFLVWDLYFLLNNNYFSGRDANQLISQVITARTYISYFIPIYGIILGIIFAMKREQLTMFTVLLSCSGIHLELLLAPFILASVAFVSRQLFWPV